jgi:hypothetical protein
LEESIDIVKPSVDDEEPLPCMGGEQLGGPLEKPLTLTRIIADNPMVYNFIQKKA